MNALLVAGNPSLFRPRCKHFLTLSIKLGVMPLVEKEGKGRRGEKRHRKKDRKERKEKIEEKQDMFFRKEKRKARPLARSGVFAMSTRHSCCDFEY